jgi:penicillin G amidase
MKIFKRILLGIITLLILVFAGVFVYLQTLKPDLAGEISLPGLNAPVEIFYDSFGVPHIYADNEEDAYFAFGYAHAQDRLFQMEMIRRAASGRLAEVLGPDLIPVDKLFRTLGFNEFAGSNASTFLSSDTSSYYRSLHAYIRGVNAFIKNGDTPIEFTVIGIPKTEFTVEDVYCAVGFMSLGFAEGFEADPVFQKIRTELGHEHLHDLAINTPADAKIIPVFNGRSKTGGEDRLISALRDGFSRLPVPLFQGSNGWVVSAEKSESGFPILANDTHIGFSQPAVWYEAHIEYPGFSFYGHHLAGVPYGILGNNRFCGWGLTMFENDDVDFFSETLNPDNPNQVKFRDQWEDLKIRREVIKVKGESDVVLEVKHSRHGPLINGIVEGVDQEEPVALSWQLLLLENRAIETLFRLSRATSFDEAERAVAMIAAPGLNFMYGDRAGNIAWFAAAKLPIRPAHVQSKVFLDGASGEDEYLGYYDFSKNPRSVNPPSGYVYSANNQPDSVEGVLYPGYYYPKGRAGRIVELLETDKKFSVSDLQQINLDHVSRMQAEIAHTIAAILEETSSDDEALNEVIDRLKKWDGNHDASLAAPTIYYAVMAQMLNSTFHDELGDKAFSILLKTAVLKNSVLSLLNKENSPWWDDVTTPDRRETRNEIILKSTRDGLAALGESMGRNMESWSWGKVHTLTHKHALGSVRLLDGFFNVGPFAVSGGSEAINNLDFVYRTGSVFEVSSGPALRKVMDFGDIENGVTVSPTGQSGNVMSRHYKDQALMFVEGKTRKMMMNEEEIRRSSGKLLMKPR